VTDSKIVSRLMVYAPELLAATTRVRARCIAATALGCDVLHAFDIQAEPFPVVVELANRAFLAAQARGADEVTAIARGGHVMLVGDSGPDGWGGHLMIRLPRYHALIDLDFQQFDRPRQQIEAPPAELFPWPDGTTSRAFTGAHGARLSIASTGDRTFERSPDWWDVARRAPIVAAVCRAIRKNRLG